MKMIDQNSPVQIESLLNEYKGNLFEYLLGSHAARYFNIEANFIKNINQSLQIRLVQYESFIREHRPELLVELNKMSQIALSSIKEELPFSPSQIYLVGKLAANTNSDFFEEADLVFVKNESQVLGLSLKLCKSHSFVNTKSAGIKSFLTKYFHSSHIEDFQSQLNQFLEKAFFSMGQKLYSMADLEFMGSFGKEWTSQYSDRPGQLPEEMNHVVVKLYQELNAKLYQLIKNLYEQDEASFVKDLRPLLGLGNDQLWQLICFHQNDKFDSIHLTKGNQLDPVCFVKLLPLKPNSSSFEIEFTKFILQIRIKPMNTFTTSAYKINCSVKYKENEDEK